MHRTKHVATRGTVQLKPLLSSHKNGVTNVYKVDASGVEPLTRERGRAILDQQARRYLNMSGDQFVAAWDAGAFDDDPDRPDVMHVAMLLSLGR